jgi:hypothetical protein
VKGLKNIIEILKHNPHVVEKYKRAIYTDCSVMVLNAVPWVAKPACQLAEELFLKMRCTVRPVSIQ